MRKYIAFFVFAFLLMGCVGATIQTSLEVHTPSETRITVGIGDLVYSSETRKSMPNAFGRADIFGRTTIAGRTTVVYAGIKDGRAFFQRKTVDIDSGETTMNSSGPIIIPNTNTSYHSGNVFTSSGGIGTYTGQSTTYAPPTIIPAPPKPQAKYIDRGVQLIFVDLKNLPQTFYVENKTVKVLKADPLKAEIILSAGSQ